MKWSLGLTGTAIGFRVSYVQCTMNDRTLSQTVRGNSEKLQCVMKGRTL